MVSLAGLDSAVTTLRDVVGALEPSVLSGPDAARLVDRVAEARYTLARRGYQASLIDLVIALACLDAGHKLVTRDRDFRAISRVVPLEVEIF